MSWLGMRVLPSIVISEQELQAQLDGNKHSQKIPPVYIRMPTSSDEVILFQNLTPPKSPLLRYNPECEEMLEILLKVRHSLILIRIAP